MLRIQLKFSDTVLSELETDQEVVTIGRNPGCDVRIENLAVSGSHARVVRRGKQYVLEDLGSTNGTFLGNEKVSQKALRHNDAVTIGKHTLVFLLGRREDGTADGPEAARKPEGRGVSSRDKTMFLETKRQRAVAEKASVAALRARGEKMGALIVLEGSTDRSDYELTGAYTMIGKDPDAGVRLKGILAPKIAGFIAREESGYSLVPPESGAKPRVNGKTVSGKVRLENGDTIELRGARMRFELRP
jgi:pSer/pThr/pTyr-binding forkhead associated (FHA) protein